MMHTSRLTSTAATIAVAAALLAPSAASAQGASPMPLAKAIVSDQVAQTTLFKYQLNSTLARQIVNACIEFGRTQKDGPRGYAIFVLAPNGDILRLPFLIMQHRGSMISVSSPLVAVIPRIMKCVSNWRLLQSTMPMRLP
jgi:hypothetical protein